MAAIVSQVLSQLGSIVTEELKQRGRLVVGAEQDVEKLTSTFTAIEALLLDAEERQLKSESIENWLKKLRDVSYEIDDVLDEWRTQILKRRLEEDDGATAGYNCLELKLLQISDVLKQVCPFLPTCCFSTDEIGLRYDIASKIKSLNESLEDIDKEKNMYNFAPRETTSFSSLQTSPNINFSEVRGREEELKELQHKLLGDDQSDHPGVRSMSIQGPGGFGKTTLAKMLYNDEEVGAHFNKRIWICVSDNFDPTTIAKAMLESLNQSTSGSALPYLLEQIDLHTRDKKFLLVLDDVWEDRRSRWEEIITSVSRGLPGSRILVTTRKEEVSLVFRCIEEDILRMKKISDDACRAIFTRIAFYGWRAEDTERVENLCGKVVRKCFGSPLAAKVLGGVLHSKRTRRDWIRILESKMWQMKEGREEVLAPLALSYYDLSPALRQCFQFCGVFPQDYQMEKDKLIRLWMSQGFLKPTMNQDAEQVGEEYFQTFVMRSFFQDSKTTKLWGGEKTCCKMHDLVHDFARLTTKNECISIPNNQDTYSSSLPSINHEVLRHLMVEGLSGEKINGLIASIGGSSRLSSSTTRSNDHYLRSFMARNGGAIEPDLYTHLRGVRSLVLFDCGLREISSTIGQLIHLRHLDLSHNYKLKELPEEICELCNLETLLLIGNKSLEMLPGGMGNKLVKLKHLENNHVPAVLPRSIVRLANSLTRLSEFTIVVCKDGGGGGGGGTNVGDLECMNKIRGLLTITGLGKVTNCEEVKRAELVKKRYITGLCLDFGGGTEEEEEQQQVMEAIRPSSNLEGLCVTNYKGGSLLFPSWLMSLCNLTTITFNGCDRVERLPPLGALPSLEELYLGDMDKVNKVGLEFLFEAAASAKRDIIAFPKLTRLEFTRMASWRVWELEEKTAAAAVMPRLRRLELEDCEELEKLADVILRKPTLERLVINYSGGLGAGYRFDRLDPKMVSRAVWDKICHIPTILLDDTDIRTTFKSEIESMSGIGKHGG
ncbi:unnamed protein product [Linum tenue]|uniref:Disease resistance protein RGA3 n=1 Tax=Linum tenue TaxID=586396 RepID=A0AAV0GPM4_9ROSI|nr:unnamed protein product [Linum tenue]